MKTLLAPLNSLIRLISKILGVNKISSETQKILLYMITAAILVNALFVTMTASVVFITASMIAILIRIR